MQGKDRLIVALDVPTHVEALALVERLTNVSFFKIGLELFLAGNLLELLQALQDRRTRDGGVFVDLKISGDIGNTIASLIKQCERLNVKFLTLSETVPFAATLGTLQAARSSRSGADPKLLMVPFLSSLDASDLKQSGVEEDLDSYILKRADTMLRAGCDGLIVSGSAIRACRDRFGSSVPLVSPGIRPAWASKNDQKRVTTPTEAIMLGSDYLVVGRPITKSSDPKGSAERIIEEIDAAILDRESQASAPDSTPRMESRP